MWSLIVIFVAHGSNYVTTTEQYTFDTEKQCNQARAELAMHLPTDYTVLTSCIGAK